MKMPAGLLKLFESSMFWFAAGILTAAALMGVTPDAWLNAAIFALGIVSGKEGVKYGSDAYKNKASA